ncbi:MAG: lipid-A-disaccharide synthase [Caulobacteraceae bacterium]
MTAARRVMLVAAEPSGDALGAALAAALRARLGADLRLFGVGGPLMAAEGIESPFDIAPLSVLGVFDALAAYPLVRRRAREVGELAARGRPDVAVLIDSWGFNLRVAHAIRRAGPGVRLIKYVAPQVWATRPGRAHTLARAVDHLLTIHAFDAPWFERAGLKTTFVGNPALTGSPIQAEPGRLRAAIGAAPSDPILLVAPGSRRGEVSRLMPPFEEAVRILAGERPRLKLVLIAADAVAAEVEERVRTWPVAAHIRAGEEARRDAMAAASAALACSGTVTTQLALAGAPVVVAYRLDAGTAVIARLLIRTRYITLMNVAAKREVAPEFVQEACTGPRLAAALAPLLDDPKARARQSADQAAALEIMRGGIVDPAGAAADAVIAQLPRA